MNIITLAMTGSSINISGHGIPEYVVITSFQVRSVYCHRTFGGGGPALMAIATEYLVMAACLMAISTEVGSTKTELLILSCINPYFNN